MARPSVLSPAALHAAASAPPPPASHHTPLVLPAGTSTAELRSAVLGLLALGPRRRFPSRLHVGRPGGRVASVDADLFDDEALRDDLLTVLVERWMDAEAPRTRPCPPAVPLIWLTRSGDLDETRTDVRWQRAARRIAAETGIASPFAVVTRHGWRTPATGSQRTWRRLRDRAAQPPRGREANDARASDARRDALS